MTGTVNPSPKTVGVEGRPLARALTVLCAGVLAVAGVASGRTLSSAALLTDSRTTGSAAVGSGTLALSVSGGATARSWTGAFSLTPGTSEYVGLTVENRGTVPMRYAVSALSTSALAAILRVDVVALPDGAAACSAAGYPTGTQASSVDGPFGGSPAIDVIGSVASGAQPGDRTLVAGGSEQLCLRVTFPLGTGAGAAARGTTATTVFTVAAESP